MTENDYLAYIKKLYTKLQNENYDEDKEQLMQLRKQMVEDYRNGVFKYTSEFLRCINTWMKYVFEQPYSPLEYRFAELLSECGIYYAVELICPEEIKGEHDGKLRLDFAILDPNDINIGVALFETDGVEFHPNPNDKKKNEYCQKKGIILNRINSTQLQPTNIPILKDYIMNYVREPGKYSAMFGINYEPWL